MTSETPVGDGVLATSKECAGLSIVFSSVTDNTSERTRNMGLTSPAKRHYDVNLTFSTGDGDTAGPYLNVNNTIIPYVLQPRITAGGAVPNKYGDQFVYVALSHSLLDRIRDLAAIAGYKVAIGDGQLLSTAEYW